MWHAADLEYGDDSLPVGWPHEQGVPSLGYEVLAWGETYLAQPDGELAGNAWQWRESQARFVAWWYAINEKGTFLFNRGQIVLPKGSGKSPLATALSCCELGGPVVFSHWDENGDPVGKPHPSPHISLAAVSYEQTSNMSSLLLSALTEGAAAEVIDGLEPGKMQVRSSNGGIYRIATSERSGEGSRSTSAFMDETHHWIDSNGGTGLARGIRRNLAKMKGRGVELTNCWLPGELSVAENTFLAATRTEGLTEKGLRMQKRTLRWHPRVHVPDLTDLDAVKAALDELYYDFPWIDTDELLQEAMSGMSSAEIRRFFLNEITAQDDALISDSEWENNRVNPDEWRPLQPGDTITLGFDGGKSDDASVLMACRVEDRSFHVLAWQERDYNKQSRTHKWEVDREVIDFAVSEAVKTYDVVGFYADVAYWESYIDKWGRELASKVVVRASGSSVVGWDMRTRLKESTRGVENLVAAVIDGVVAHNGDSRLRRHVLNTRRRYNTWGLSFGKESRESPKKVDGFASTLLADMARTDYEQSGKAARRKKRKGGKLLVG